MSRPGTPGPAARFTCARCGGEAAVLTLLPPGADDTVTGLPVLSHGFVTLVIDAGRLSSRIGTAGAGSPEARRAMEEADAAGLHALDPEFAPFWCPRCMAAYCAKEWRVWDVYDPDAPNWWEELRGVCPEGHERRIYD